MPVKLMEGAEPIPGYRLVRLLGQGGFGQVWESEAPGKMRVALKFIRTDTGHSDLELRAIEAIRDIRHPHLLEMHFCLIVEEYLVIATSLCDKSLLDRFREFTAKGEPGIPLDPLLRYMEETAVAIDFLNGCSHKDASGRTVGIQHRDIKPHNIFLVGDSVKVADFGLAKALEHSVTNHTGAMTPHYAPPEMFKNAVSTTSDQYSLAVSYFQLRTGKLPFSGSVHQIIYAHIHEPPNLADLMPAERSIVARALSKEPTDRWPSCKEFVTALKQACLLGAPVRSSPLPEFPQSASSSERNQPVHLETADTKTTTQAHVPTHKVEQRPTKTPPTILRHRVGIIALAVCTVSVSLASVAYLRTAHRETHFAKENPKAVKVSKQFPLELLNEPESAAIDPKQTDQKEIDLGSKEDSKATEDPKQFPPESPSKLKPPLANAPFDAAQAKELQQQWAAYLSTEPAIENAIGMKLALIPPGEFMMGSELSFAELASRFDLTPEDAERFYAAEHPRHRVRINNPFFVGVHEVTVGQFRQFVDDDGYRTEAETDGTGGFGYNATESNFEGPNSKYNWKHTGFPQDDSHPVVNVTWNDVQAFIKWLSKKSAKKYRLLTEAEWEYACRAGTQTLFHAGNKDLDLVGAGNVADQTAKGKFPNLTITQGTDGHVFTAPAGRFAPNAFGLHDMHGNVWEWCGDFYDRDYYRHSPAEDPSGPSGEYEWRVRRGGSWYYFGGDCRSAERSGEAPDSRFDDVGFRVALELD